MLRKNWIKRSRSHTYRKGLSFLPSKETFIRRNKTANVLLSNQSVNYECKNLPPWPIRMRSWRLSAPANCYRGLFPQVWTVSFSLIGWGTLTITLFRTLTENRKNDTSINLCSLKVLNRSIYYYLFSLLISLNWLRNHCVDSLPATIKSCENSIRLSEQIIEFLRNVCESYWR